MKSKKRQPITITQKQLENYNKMWAALKKISRLYQTPDQVRRTAGELTGLDYTEALEMAYENIRADAKTAIKGVKCLPDFKLAAKVLKELNSLD